MTVIDHGTEVQLDRIARRFPDTRSDVDVSARLTLWGLWTAQAAHVDTIPITSLAARGGVFSDSEAASISTAPAVATTQFAIPAEGYLLIEASVAADSKLTHGDVDADFASGNLSGVGFAYAVITLPPG